MRDLTECFRLAAHARAENRVGDAWSLYHEALKLQPHLPSAIRALMDLHTQVKFDLIQEAQLALSYFSTESAEAAILQFAIAKGLDDLCQYQEAWQHLVIANRTQRALIGYEVETDLSTMRSLEASFACLPPAGLRGEEPIFIVGLPRCGSTLLERVISASPHVVSIGESPVMPDTVRRLATWSELLDGPDWSIDVHELARQYILGTGFSPAGTHALDKQLLNFCYVPLILAAFPRAKIVHIRRHPLACALGLFRQRFPGTWPFTYQLDEIAAFYVGYHALMHQCARVANNSHFLEIRYEDLVTRLAPTARRLYEFLELPFIEAALRPDQNVNRVYTMSAQQVREPVHTRAVEHWHHYSRYLEPVRATLQFAGIPVDRD